MTRPPRTLEELRAAFKSRKAPVLAAAAKSMRDSLLEGLEKEALAAFERLLPEKASDPGCLAKTGIVRALLALEERARFTLASDVVGRVLVPGARHVQREAVWGGRVDVAGDLRIASAAGLLLVGADEARTVLTDHLADPEPSVRRAAAKNLAARGGAEAAPLLRLRARWGDEDPALLGEYLRALLAVEGEVAVEVAEAWLLGDDEVCAGEAALALGASKLDGACPALTRAWEATYDAERRRVLLAAFAMLRSDEATSFVAEVVKDATVATAVEAIEAFAPYAAEEVVRRILEQAVDQRSEDEVRRAFRDAFDPA